MLDLIMRPELVGQSFGGRPMMAFEEREVRGKMRLIGIPNRYLRRLHQWFGTKIREAIQATNSEGFGVRKLPSATGSVPGSNPLENARRHQSNGYFYITDLRDAYPSVSLERLARFLVFLARYEEYVDRFSLRWFARDDRTVAIEEDEVYLPMLNFLRVHFSGRLGEGLAIGGPLSPYLMNLYCEVYLDASLRRLCERREHGYQITYTRYVDDLVFSAPTFIGPDTRRAIRQIIEASGFEPNRRKSVIRIRSMGPVWVTKIGLEQSISERSRFVYPQKKRRRLHGLIHQYLTEAMDEPEKVSGYIAEFLHYWKQVPVKTASDQKTFALCQEFRAEWDRYGGPKPRRRRRR